MTRFNEMSNDQRHQYFLFIIQLPAELLTPIDNHIIKIYDRFPVESIFDVVEE
jgi:hypothetical protein